MSTALMLLLHAGLAQAGPISSVSFTGPNPQLFAIYLDGREVPFVASSGSFVMAELAPGPHAFRMTMNGSEALTADFTTTAGTHEVCTILVQPFGYDTRCVAGGNPLRWADLGIRGPGVSPSAPAAAAPRAAATPPARPTPMSATSLARLVTAVDDASFSSDRVGLIQGAASKNHFTCAQVVALLGPLSHSSDKLAAVEALAPKVVDPENAHEVEAAMDFSTDKAKVRAMF